MQIRHSIQTTLAAIIITVAMGTTAHAGVNTCEGTVQVGPQWTTVVGETGNYAPSGCRFSTASKLGRRIIAACPNGSKCVIDVSLKELKEGSDAPLSEAAIRKLCPNPDAKCMARDNPDFDKPARTIKTITSVERGR